MSIFYKLKESNGQLLWEGKYFFCLLDGFPVSPGHSLIIPQREIQSVMELDTEEWSSLFESIKKTINILSAEKLINSYRLMQESSNNDKAKKYLQDTLDHIEEKGYSPDAYNHGVNDGIASGRTVHHLHWHLIPRFNGDVEDPMGGVRYIFPEKANYRKD